MGNAVLEIGRSLHDKSEIRIEALEVLLGGYPHGHARPGLVNLIQAPPHQFLAESTPSDVLRRHHPADAHLIGIRHPSWQQSGVGQDGPTLRSRLLLGLHPQMKAESILVVEVLVDAILLHDENFRTDPEQGIQLVPVQSRPRHAPPIVSSFSLRIHGRKIALLPRYFCAMAGGNVLSVEGLTKRFGERLIFEDLHFGLDRGQKAALVARNGTGKSTLMKVLLDLEAPDTGTVTFAGDVRIAHLSQDHGLDVDRTILANLFAADNAAMRAIRQYEEATKREDADALQSAYDAMDRADAWSYEAQAKEILGKLGLHDTDRFVDNLSGGEKRRVALAKCLIEQPDLLLLDEPTNHLDLGMIEWLEGYLARAKTTLLMVTHDRFFLEVVCDTILELENFTLHKYPGNWSYFLEKKSERSANEHAQRDRARSIMRRELEWVRATPQARTGKSKSRLDAFKGLKKKASVRLEEDEVRLELDPARLGGKILELHRVRKAYTEDKVILDGWTYHFKPGERVGLVGDNGAGKSTLIHLMTGEDIPDGGKVVIGDTVVFGHFSQEPPNFDEGMKVIEALYEIAEFMPLKKGKKLSAGQLLERFLFPRHRHHDFIHKLSGGERKRLHLLRVLMANPNFLVFDEPTNDLDVFTLGILEEFLLDFPGCLLLVSHDRYFMDKLVDHVFVLDGLGGVRDFPGNYTQYRTKADGEEKAQSARDAVAAKLESDRKAAENSSGRKGDYSQRLSYNEQREYDGLEDVIAALETEKTQLESALSAPDLDHEEVTRLANRLGEVTADIETKTERWIELDERA